MNAPSTLRGLTPADLAFIEDHCRDTALASGGTLDHVPYVAAALSDACLVVRRTEADRLIGLAVAIDRGIERQVFIATVQFAARGRGLARQLLNSLVAGHLNANRQNRAVASVWPGVRGGGGLLLISGFETARGQVRMSRDISPVTAAGTAAGIRWLDVEHETPDRRMRLVQAAADAWPGDENMLPTLAALANSPIGFMAVGFAGNDAKVVAAGHRANGQLDLTLLYTADSVKDPSLADHALLRVTEAARARNERQVLIETTGPSAAAIRMLFAHGFRAEQAAAGFRIGPPPRRLADHVFAV